MLPALRNFPSVHSPCHLGTIIIADNLSLFFVRSAVSSKAYLSFNLHIEDIQQFCTLWPQSSLPTTSQLECHGIQGRNLVLHVYSIKGFTTTSCGGQRRIHTLLPFGFVALIPKYCRAPSCQLRRTTCDSKREARRPTARHPMPRPTRKCG